MKLAAAVGIALLGVSGAVWAEEQPAHSLLLTPSIGLAAPVGAFAKQNPAGWVVGLGFDVPVSRRNQLGIRYQLQRYRLDVAGTEWIGGVSVHDRMFMGEGGLFVEGGLGLYFDARSGGQEVLPLRHTSSASLAATSPAKGAPTRGLDAAIGWRFPGRSIALMAGYQVLFAQRVRDGEALGRTQCLVFGLQAGLQLP